ncbi:MAG: DUF4258 domain-containing protein [Gaiellaceae bacterium]
MRQAFTRAGLYYTSHAAEQMERRAIDPEDVEAAFETCDTTYPGSDRRRENLVKVGTTSDDRRLHVVVKRERPFVVVSAFWGED